VFTNVSDFLNPVRFRDSETHKEIAIKQSAARALPKETYRRNEKLAKELNESRINALTVKANPVANVRRDVKVISPAMILLFPLTSQTL